MTRGRTNTNRDRAAAARKPKPPAQLTDAEGHIWTKVCASQSGEWCEAASAGMGLTMYCVARAFYEATLAGMHAEIQAAESEGFLPVATRWHKVLADLEPRLMNLETKLRLTPQSKVRADAPGGPSAADPWAQDEDTH